jgi:hypothetical protein
MLLLCVCQIPALSDHGWDEFGPTNETLHSIYRTLPFYPESNKTVVVVILMISKVNLIEFYF